MQEVQLPLFKSAYKNVDPISLREFSDELINGYLDETGTLNRFPGTEELCDLGTGPQTGIDGIYWWDRLQKFVAVSDGRTFTIDDKDGTFSEITGDLLLKQNPVSFTDNGTTLVLANGGKMQLTDGTTATANISDTDAPTQVSHVAFLDSYIIANNNLSGSFFYSEVASPADWSSLNFASAEANPDFIQALDVNYREMILFGSQSIETYYNDGVTPFSRLDGGYTERGISAKHSLTKANNTMFFLDNDKRFTMLEGRTPKIVSTPFDRFISQKESIEDVRGFNITIDGNHFVIFNFLEENLTLGYDYQRNSWFRLGLWDQSTATYDRWIGSCYESSAPWGINLVGSRIDGKIYKLSSSVYDDDSSFIRLVRSTGNINHGTNAVKKSGKVVLTVKRGHGTSGTPVVQVRYKDDGDLNWSTYIDGDLGLLGDKEFYIVFEPMGMYRSRQYEFVITDSVPFSLVGASEWVEVMPQ